MKILICPDSFKESLSSIELSEIIEKAIKRILPKVKTKKIPLADGGEGTVKILVKSENGRIIHCYVKDPLGRKIKSYLGILPDRTAVIEMASASGLSLLSSKERNPLITATYGTGQLIKKALEIGCKKIIVGIGGSATIDGGAGMA